LVQPYSNGLATTIVVVCVTYVTLVLGELVPKRIGLSAPERISKAVAAPLRFFIFLMYPFIWFLTVSSNLLSYVLNIKKNDNQVTEEEIKAIINEGTEQGTIEEAEQEIIERVFHLGDRNITSLMTHRSEIEWLDVSKKVGEMKMELGEAVHSIYPVCEGSIDNIVGIVSIKDLFAASDNEAIKDIMRQPVYVPENNSAYQVLEKFKATKVHHCFIVNEYGDIEGLITLNDILDAIVGDVPEPDEESYEIVKRADGSFLIDGQISFYDFLKYFDKREFMHEGEHDFDTLAGFILHLRKEIPKTGDSFSWKGFDFEIVDMDQHRIDKVLVSLKNDGEGDEN
jgi:putative hemolysin